MDLAGEDRAVVLESEVRAHHVRSRAAQGQHDRREIRLLVGIALDQERLHAPFLEGIDQGFHAIGAEGVGRIDDRPFAPFELVHPVIGDHFRGVEVIGAAAEQPAVPHMGEGGIGAAEHHRPRRLGDVGGDRLHLRGADGADEGDTVAAIGQPAESEHRARIGRLVVLDHEFEGAAEHPALLIDLVDGEPGAVELDAPGLGAGPGEGGDHPDLERLGGMGTANDEGCGEDEAASGKGVTAADGHGHPNLPQGFCFCSSPGPADCRREAGGEGMIAKPRPLWQNSSLARGGRC